MNGITIQNPSGAIQQVPNPVNVATVTQVAQPPDAGTISIVLWGSIQGSILDQIDLQQQFALKAGIAELNAHIADHNNPHAVTKGQVGLGNVANLTPDQLALAIAPTIGPLVSVTSAQISDANASGRTILTAATAPGVALANAASVAAQRTALGAGATGASIFQASTPAAVLGTLSLSQQPSRRNFMDNADWSVDQTPVGVLGAALGGYITDQLQFANGFGRMSAQLVNTGSPLGVTNNILFTVTAASAPAAAEVTGFYQQLEGQMLAQLQWGTGTAQPITFSIEVNCSVAGTYTLSFRNAAANRSYVTQFTVNAANTWELKTVTIPGDTGGVWPFNGTAAGMSVHIGLSVGTTGSTASPNTWLAGNFTGITGQTQLAATAGATFRLGRWQMELGTIATPFEFVPYDQNLLRCQRYSRNMLNGGASDYWPSMGFVTGGGAVGFMWGIPVQMRVAPTLGTNGNFVTWNATSTNTVTSVSMIVATPRNVYISAAVTGAPATNLPMHLQANSAGARLELSARF